MLKPSSLRFTLRLVALLTVLICSLLASKSYRLAVDRHNLGLMRSNANARLYFAQARADLLRRQIEAGESSVLERAQLQYLELDKELAQLEVAGFHISQNRAPGPFWRIEISVPWHRLSVAREVDLLRCLSRARDVPQIGFEIDIENVTSVEYGAGDTLATRIQAVCPSAAIRR